MRCVLCQRKINKKKDTYFKVELFSSGKKMGTDYAHKICWNNKNNLNSKLNNLVSGISDFASSHGIIPEPKVVIV